MARPLARRFPEPFIRPESCSDVLESGEFSAENSTRLFTPRARVPSGGSRHCRPPSLIGLVSHDPVGVAAPRPSEKSRTNLTAHPEAAP